jgi:DNA polymerase-4
MSEQYFSVRSSPRAILHIDGDAFFASCEQASNPLLRGKPVITGKEKGVAISMSYEAQAMGVTRGMKMHDIRKICPQAIILPSDYETYGLYSKNFFNIVRRWTPDVEEYGIDECFADVTGLRGVFKMSYEEVAIKIKHDLDKELGFTFSVGLAPSKVLAKVGSKWKKPSGLTIIKGRDIHTFLKALPAKKIWGIGYETSEYLAKLGVYTALEYARKSEPWIRAHFTKPHIEIWQELQGQSVIPLVTTKKETFHSMQKVKTFTPASRERAFIFSQLSKNIESICIKLRRHHLAANEGRFFLKRQDFKYNSIELAFTHAISTPAELIKSAAKHFDEIFNPKLEYRATGVILSNIINSEIRQMDLFGEVHQAAKEAQLYSAVDKTNAKFGKHTVYLASSYKAKYFEKQLEERGDIPRRKLDLFLGETEQKRIYLPMLMEGVR